MRSEMIMGFAYEYTYQDREYIIRTMNTKRAQSPAIHSACTPIATYGFPVPCLHTRLHSVAANQLVYKSDLGEKTLLRDFYSQSHAVLPFGYIYQPTSPCPTLFATLNQCPKDIAGSDIEDCAC